MSMRRMWLRALWRLINVGLQGEFFKNVHKDFPGVRFDIEMGDNNLRVVTTM